MPDARVLIGFVRDHCAARTFHGYNDAHATRWAKARGLKLDVEGLMAYAARKSSPRAPKRYQSCARS